VTSLQACKWNLFLFQPTYAQIYIYITTVSLYIMYTPTSVCHPQGVVHLCLADLARYKCKTPWGWHTDVKASRSVHYI